jgi:Concanavalin A-like lectin/glucanases superfamily
VHLRLATTASIVDRKSTLASVGYTGSGQTLVSGLPTDSDGAIDFAGTASGSLAHVEALELEAFNLSFWFIANDIPEDGDRWALVCLDGSGDTTGDFVTMLEDDASITIGFKVTGLPRKIVTPPPITVGQAHHLVVRADNTGLDAYLDGVYLGKNTYFTDAWSENVSPLRLASVPWRLGTADVVRDEVAVYDYVLTEAQVLALALRSDLPIANSLSANVPESATTTIDVVANDSFSGAKAGLTVTIVDDTEVDGAGHSVSVNEDNDIDFVASAVTADEEVEFTYRIEDTLGTSNTATVTVTVQNAAASPAIANCYVENATNPIVVNNTANLGGALATAITTAAATGRNILIAAGTYTGGTATFNPAGTAANPVVIRPRGAVGSVIVNNATWTVAAGSARLVISKLYFNSAHIELNGTHHRVTRCRFRQVGRPVLVTTDAGYCVTIKNGDFMRVDHCDMSDWLALNTAKGFVNFEQPEFTTGGHRDALVDYNYLHDYSSPPGSANAANVFNTSSGSGAWRYDARVVFDHNLVRNATPLRDNEFVTCKFSGVVFSFNTFENIDGYLQQRQGGGWEVRSNWLENMGNVAPLKSFDDFGAGEQSGAGRALVIGNRLVGNLSIWICSGNSATVGPNFYHASREGRYIGNIVGGAIRVGFNYDGATSVVPATNNLLWNNTGTVILNHQTGTIQNVPDNEPFKPAVKIPVPTGNPATDRVGLSAPDPLCPAGPRS